MHPSRGNRNLGPKHILRKSGSVKGLSEGTLLFSNLTIVVSCLQVTVHQGFDFCDGQIGFIIDVDKSTDATLVMQMSLTSALSGFTA